MINLRLQELNFTLYPEQFNIAIFNPKTLQTAGVIDSSWQLIEEPIYQSNRVKLVFSNKVRLAVYPDKIIVAETVGQKRLQDIKAATTVQHLVTGFPELRYRAVVISPGGFAQFNSATEACKYMSEGLLASTPWQKFQGQEINAVNLKLAYPYKSGKFYLDINQVSLDISGKSIPAIWFAGNFNFQLQGQNSATRSEDLSKILKDWGSDISSYQNFINNELLAISVIPSVSVFL